MNIGNINEVITVTIFQVHQIKRQSDPTSQLCTKIQGPPVAQKAATVTTTAITPVPILVQDQPPDRQTLQSPKPQTNAPYPARNPALDPLLNAAREQTPLCPSVRVPHSLGTLYPTNR